MNAQDMQQEAGDCKADTSSFVMFYTSNWFGGTEALTYEQKGFYVDLLFRMWERKGPLPDDQQWLAAHLGCDPRIIRRLRADLIRLEKLESRDGFLSNRRMMKEIAKMVRRERPAAAPKPVRRNSVADPLLADFRQTSGKDQPELPNIFPEKPIKSEGASPLSRSQIPELEEQQSAIQQDAERGRADEDLILDLRKWVPPERARACLDAMIADYGHRGVRRGHDRLRQHMARGKPVRDPPGLWLAMCRRMRDESDGDNSTEMAEFKRRSQQAREFMVERYGAQEAA